MKAIVLAFVLLAGCSPAGDKMSAGFPPATSHPNGNEQTGDLPTTPTQPIAVKSASSSGASYGLVSVHSEIESGYIPYQSAKPEDASNGRLAQLLRSHRLACAGHDPNAYFKLFSQKTRYLYEKKYDQQELLENFQMACSEPVLGKYEQLLALGQLAVAKTGSTEQGGIVYGVCPSAEVSDGVCRESLEVATEAGRLVWDWH